MSMLRYIYHSFAVLIFAFIFTILHILSFYQHSVLDEVNIAHYSMQETEYDCVVVFGAAVWPGYFGPVASHALRDRTLSAVDLYNNKLTQCIILSGGESIYGAHEVDVMTDILLENNVPESVIELDREGVNTIATINNLNKSRSYILVSNDFHLARIGLLAQRAGLGDAGFALHAAEYRVGGRYRREYYFTAREAVALWYYFFVTLI